MSIQTSGWNLFNIRQKVRLVTGRPSQDQLSDDSVNAYINDYYAYTMPHELKVQIQNAFLDFKTTPGINVYSFPGAYLTDSPGAYADGFPLIFYEDPDIFYQDWPQQYAVDNVATGTGLTASFSGGLQNPPVIIGSLFITDGVQVVQDIGFSPLTVQISTGNGGTAYSGTLGTFPVTAGTFNVTTTQEDFADNGNGTMTGSQGGSGTINYANGAWTLTFASALAAAIPIIASYTVPGLGVLQGNGSGTINYLTGAFTVTFTNAPPATATIYAKYQGYQANRPQGVLWWENQFTLMPVPDQVYQIRMQGYVFPQQLLLDSDVPTQAEWGPLIAYGAALSIFDDNGDRENYDRYFPVFKRYENVALSRTIQQYTPEQGVPRF